MGRLKFGISPCQEKQRFQDTLEQCIKAEEWGYDSIWMQEHHGADEGYYPSPLVALAGVAARTERVQLGTSVLILPYYHPVHVAEDTIMVDVISRGRMVLGVGAGYREPEFSYFGVPFHERIRRFREGLEVLHLAFRGEPFDYEGTFFRLSSVRVLPSPVQAPRPPLWVGGWGKTSLRLAARYGDAWIPGPTANLEKLQEALGHYRQALQEEGKDPSAVEFPLLRELFVAASAAHKEEALRHLRHMYMEDYVRWSHQNVASDTTPSFDSLLRDRFIVGYPDEVIEALVRFHDALGFDHLIARMHFHSMRQEAVLESMRLFAREVMPYLRSRERGRQK